MKISDVIAAVAKLRPNHRFVDGDIINWLSGLDKKIQAEIAKSYGVATILQVTGTSAYTLPVGVIFNNIAKVLVNGVEYEKLDVNSYGKTGYWLQDAKINIYPASSVTDGELAPTIRITYLTIPATYALTTQDLFVPAPYDDMYELYVASRMDLYNRQYDDYNNMVSLYNDKYESYANFYGRTAPSSNIQSKNYM